MAKARGVRGTDRGSPWATSVRASNCSPLFVALSSLLGNAHFCSRSSSPTRSPPRNTPTPSETPQGEDACPEGAAGRHQGQEAQAQAARPREAQAPAGWSFGEKGGTDSRTSVEGSGTIWNSRRSFSQSLTQHSHSLTCYSVTIPRTLAHQSPLDRLPLLL